MSEPLNDWETLTMDAQDTDSASAPKRADRHPADDPTQLFPREGMQHPISERAAWDLCGPFVGLVRCSWRIRRSDHYVFDEAIKAWWGRLRSSRLPEERLSCERMINALSLANGLDQHKRGADLTAENVKHFTSLRREAAQARREQEEAACVDAWRGFSPCA
ncbi:hypothetical protein RGQ15_07045 [Paracoccus sp. MBLB3053]|uniref:DUF1376 domain-containing protein n=1 Tax=Paracoccus aurantius TaxID=3073814 RepID=A0ABU2HSP6_9RHOB|nr:hypothetical protein [Paracoccus sp. MBLB3053]MDS9467329.1 hypothetical protein [Paracoccus sp. MBLB3053]